MNSFLLISSERVQLNLSLQPETDYHYEHYSFISIIIYLKGNSKDFTHQNLFAGLGEYSIGWG